MEVIDWYCVYNYIMLYFRASFTLSNNFLFVLDKSMITKQLAQRRCFFFIIACINIALTKRLL